MAKISTREVRELLEAERERVLRQLRALARKDEAARAKELARRRKFRMKATTLINEGKELGVAITDMAEAAGVTRQMAHSWLRAGENGTEPIDEE